MFKRNPTISVRRKFQGLFLGIVLFSCRLAFPSELMLRLETDIEDQYLDEFTKVEASFILSGVDHPDSLFQCVAWYNHLLDTVQKFQFDLRDHIGSANRIFAWLHSHWLRQYERDATTLLDIRNRKCFNCVSGTILFNLLCEDLGWPVEAFETPTHVYTVLNFFPERIMIENTSSMGFNILKNLRAYSEFLLQFYPKDKRFQIGLDRIYAYEQSKGRPIDNTELLGLLAYNRAYFFRKQNEYEKAYRLVLLAQKFNHDSRSNVDFEITLYYQWGKCLADQERWIEAFQVFASGFERHPEISDFGKNTKAIFSKLIDLNVEWQELRPLSDKILSLNVLSPQELLFLKNYLAKMASRYAHKGDMNNAEQIQIYLQSHHEFDME